EAAGSAESGGGDSGAIAQRSRAELDIAADGLGGRLAFDEPRATAETKLDVVGSRGQNIDMIVGVIADGVPGLDDAAQPVHVFLFEDSADREAMSDAAGGADAPTRFDGVAFRFLVEVALLVVPVRGFPS